MSDVGSIASYLAISASMSAYPLMATERTRRDVRSVPILLQKSKVAGQRFFRENTKWDAIDNSIISIALPKSPVSFARGDEVPHIFTRKPRLQPAEFLITSAKRLLQHNLPKANIAPEAVSKTRRQGTRALSVPDATTPSLRQPAAVRLRRWPCQDPWRSSHSSSRSCVVRRATRTS